VIAIEELAECLLISRLAAADKLPVVSFQWLT
jgi:hypothetical protein